MIIGILAIVAVVAAIVYFHGIPLQETQTTIGTLPTSTRTGCGAGNIIISEPFPGASVGPSFFLKITVDNRKAQPGCSWTVFEAQAGVARVYNEKGKQIGMGLLQTNADWMNAGPTDFSGTVLITATATPEKIYMIIAEDDPSGLGQPDTVEIPLVFKN